jgi:hypothetical protein
LKSLSSFLSPSFLSSLPLTSMTTKRALFIEAFQQAHYLPSDLVSLIYDYTQYVCSLLSFFLSNFVISIEFRLSFDQIGLLCWASVQRLWRPSTTSFAILERKTRPFL